MELSTTADWLGVLTGCALGLGWIRNFYLRMRRQVTETEKIAELSSSLVDELLRNATSPARRADIHAYLDFRAMKFESRQTRRLINQLAMALSTAVIGCMVIVLYPVLEGSQFPWLWWFLLINFVVVCIAFGMVLFYDWQLRRMELAWQTTAFKALEDRAFRHVSGTNP